jgi:hypothetical protein
VTSGSPATVHGLAELIGRQRALDLLLFELTGRWATDTDDPALAPFWAARSRDHAWHAELWADRFPALPGFDLEAATTAAERSLDDAVALRDARTSQDRLARYGAVVTRLIDEIHAVEQTLDPRLDAPTARILALVLHDLREVREVHEVVTTPSPHAPAN